MRTAFVFAVSLSVAGASHAAWVNNIDFESASHYDNAAAQTTGFFRDTGSNSAVSLSNNGAANDFLRYTVTNTTSGNTGITLYDTTPAGAGVNNFLDEEVRVDFRVGVNNDSFGILLRLNASGSNGYLVVLNPNSSGSNDNFRILSGATAIGGTGTAVASSTNVANFITTNTWYTLVAKATTVGSNVGLTASVYPQGDLTTALRTLSGTHTNGTIAAGQVGLRFGDNSSGTSTAIVDADNFAIVPEPGALGLLAGAGLLLRRRRRD